MTENQKARAWDALKKAILAASTDPFYSKFHSDYKELIMIMTAVEMKVQEVDDNE